ncbi:peptidylprolyl isomerase [Achromatium sp. WMS2]|nr:peptidylprolyl isomerase [Achromatium sp. WMS2]
MTKNTEVVQPGKFVAITYTIYDREENTLLEHNDLPIGYVYGGPQTLIGGMEEAVLGRSVGDTIELMVAPENGFGQYDPNLTFTDELDNVPEEFRHLGAAVPMQNDAGDIKNFYVTRIANGHLTVDGNHPMAGKTLKVHVRILEVRDATKEDLGTVPINPMMYH